MAHEYTCAHCGGHFVSELEQEDAHAESTALWGKRGDDTGMAEVCDDCWKAFMSWHRQETR